MTRYRLVLAGALFLALTACQSLTTKQTVSSAHLTARAAITALDDTERDACRPDASKLKCTRTPALIADAAHARINATLIRFYEKDVAISRAIVDWAPGAPMPASLTALIAEARVFITDLQALAPSLTSKAQTLLDRLQALADKWIGGRQ